MTLNSIPIQVIAAQGGGTQITVLNAYATITFASAAYAANVGLQLYIDTAPRYIGIIVTALDAASTMTLNFGLQPGTSATGTQYVQNKGLFVTVPAGNPTTGDGTLFIKVYYTVN